VSRASSEGPVGEEALRSKRGKSFVPQKGYSRDRSSNPRTELIRKKRERTSKGLC